MEKRSIRLGDYDTAVQGLWTLTTLEFPTPDPVTNMIQVPGRITGPLDLSTVLTNGEPRYGSRTLRAVLESSDGNRAARQTRINEMVNQFHGQRVNIVLPDYPEHYAVGRLTVRQLYNDLAHASVEVTGVCEPWLYALEETLVTANLTTASFTALSIPNTRKPAVPTVKVTTDTVLRWKGTTLNVSAGTYTSLDLILTEGENTLEARSATQAGTITITYREGTL